MVTPTKQDQVQASKSVIPLKKSGPAKLTVLVELFGSSFFDAHAEHIRSLVEFDRSKRDFNALVAGVILVDTHAQLTSALALLTNGRLATHPVVSNMHLAYGAMLSTQENYIAQRNIYLNLQKRVVMNELAFSSISMTGPLVRITLDYLDDRSLPTEELTLSDSSIVNG